MKLLELETKLQELSYTATLKQIANAEKKTVEDRLYVTLSPNYSTYFIDFEKKPFLKIFVQRPKGFDYSNGKGKQTEEDNIKCRNAKFQMLKALIDDGVEGLENYESEDKTLTSPKSSAKRLNIA